MACTAKQYLRKHEWSMGHGQCPDCCGLSTSFLNGISRTDKEDIGHEKECKLASALVDVGENPLMKQT